MNQIVRQELGDRTEYGRLIDRDQFVFQIGNRNGLIRIEHRLQNQIPYGGGFDSPFLKHHFKAIVVHLIGLIVFYQAGNSDRIQSRHQGYTHSGTNGFPQRGDSEHP